MTSTRELEAEAEQVRADLDFDDILATVGVPHLVGSAALGLMVWRDLDMTVVCERLDIQSLYAAIWPLVTHHRVRQLTLRNDTGTWNVESDTYPDGIYLGVDYRHDDRRWNLDIWFVADAERQPDLQHVREIAPQLSDDTREAILTIKRAWYERPEYRRSVTSVDIYRAVLRSGVRTPAQFEQLLAETADNRT